MSNEDLRWYAIHWYDARSMPDGQKARSAAVRAADMKDAITLFDREGEELSGFTWRKGERYRIRPIAKDDCQDCCGEGQGAIGGSGSHILAPGMVCPTCNGVGRRTVE